MRQRALAHNFPLSPVKLVVALVLLAAPLSAYFILAHATTQTAAPSLDPHYYGVNWHPMWINAGGQNAEMDLMQQAGVKSVRLDAEWYFMEQSQGTYQPTYLARFDNAISGLVARGIDPEIIITSTPTWVTHPPATDPDPMHEPPVRGKVNSDCDPTQTICSTYNHVSNYNNFLTFLINRYKGKVHAYEIWNEPDGGWAWRTTGAYQYPQDDIDRGVDYATLLKSAYPAAKAADPTVTVVGGVLSNATAPQAYMLTSMYQNGAKGNFDVWAQHLYCDPPGHNWCNSDRNVYDPQTLANTFTANIVPVLQQNGDGSKPVWIDETGYNSYSAGGGVTEAVQGSYLTQAFSDDRALPNVARVFWYEMDDSSTGTSTEDYYGLIAADMYNADSLPAGYRLKPAYTAFKQLATAATPSPSPTPTPTPAKTGDLNGDGKVDIFDLSALLSAWGTTSTTADLNHDGTVNIFDISILLSHWGT